MPLPDEDAARAFFAALDFKAVNVTIPYKPVSYTHLDVYKRQNSTRWFSFWLA